MHLCKLTYYQQMYIHTYMYRYYAELRVIIISSCEFNVQIVNFIKNSSKLNTPENVSVLWHVHNLY